MFDFSPINTDRIGLNELIEFSHNSSKVFINNRKMWIVMKEKIIVWIDNNFMQ